MKLQRTNSRAELSANGKRLKEGFVRERNRIEDEMNSIKVDIKSLETGSGGLLGSADSTGYGLGSGTFAQPLASARWQGEWAPRKIEIQGWVTDSSRKHLQGVLDQEVNLIMDEINAALGAELKTEIAWEHSKES